MVELALCIPVKDPYVTLDFAWCFRKLKLPKGTHIFFDRSHQPIDSVRENLVEEALEVEPEYILFIDSDLLFPSMIYYILKSNEYPVVSGLYPDKGNRWCAAIEGKDNLPVYLNCRLEEIKNKTLFVDYVGAGCLLIESEVFKKLSKPWFKYEYDKRNKPYGLSEDFYFCKKIRKELGIKIMLDCRVICSHVFVGCMKTPNIITHLEL